MTSLWIRAGEVAFEVALRDAPAANALLAARPFESWAQTWGEELYFEAPMSAALEPDAKIVVPPGTVCFWVEGQSISIPFGPTPASRGANPRLASRCNVLGALVGDPRVLARVRAGDRIVVAAG